MKNLSLSPQQLLAIKGLLNEGKINNLFSTPVESTVADHGGHDGKESKVKDSSRSSCYVYYIDLLRDGNEHAQ